MFKKLIGISLELINLPAQRQKHFCFALRRNRVVSMGWNVLRTHPVAYDLNYPYYFIHAELACYLNAPYNTQWSKCKLVSLRLDRKGRLRLAKPCLWCQNLITDMAPREVWFSDQSGNFVRL